MATWSDIWSKKGLTRKERSKAVKLAAYTAPSSAKSRKGGKYPHEQSCQLGFEKS